MIVIISLKRYLKDRILQFFQSSMRLRYLMQHRQARQHRYQRLIPQQIVKQQESILHQHLDNQLESKGQIYDVPFHPQITQRRIDKSLVLETQLASVGMDVQLERTEVAIEIAHQAGCHEDLLARFKMDYETVFDEGAADCEALLLLQEADLVEELVLPKMWLSFEEE